MIHATPVIRRRGWVARNKQPPHSFGLLNSVSDNYQYLLDSSGVVHLTDYYSSTTASDSTPGGVAGYEQQHKVARGESGTPVLLDSNQYIARNGTGGNVFPEANYTVYRNSDGTGAATTTYAYTWYGSTMQAQSVTTTSPVVTATQNGPGAADVSVAIFDSYGRPKWFKDGDGFITNIAYDDATGAVLKTIRDVDTSHTSDFTGLPSGWSTPSGGGLHLLTSMEVDAVERTTKVTDANGNVTCTVYNDAAHEIRTYRGWDSGTRTATGPTDPGSGIEMGIVLGDTPRSDQ